jgi:hypothetical protein
MAPTSVGEGAFVCITLLAALHPSFLDYPFSPSYLMSSHRY